MIFDTVISPDNNWLIACSTYGDLFIWNIKSILKNANKIIKTKRHEIIAKTNNNFIFDDDDDYDYDENLNGYDDLDEKKSNDIIAENKPLFVFRAYEKTVLEPIYTLSTMNNLLFVGTFEALYIFKWSDIMKKIQENLI